MSELDPDILCGLETYLDEHYEELVDNICMKIVDRYVTYRLGQSLGTILEPYLNEAFKNCVARHKSGPLTNFLKKDGVIKRKNS